MKFLDANGLALFTKKIFNKFVSNVSGADNKITITKGDGTKNEINLNEVLKTDEIAENPPEDDNTLKIPSTSWVQSFLNYLFSIESANTDNIKSKIKSWAQEQINSWLETLGIRYNIAQNGYICLGKLFGDAIIQWGYFKLEDNQKDVENIISLPLTVKNNYLTWVNKHGTLIYTNMFYTVAPDKTNFRFYTNTVGGYMWGSIGFI